MDDQNPHDPLARLRKEIQDVEILLTAIGLTMNFAPILEYGEQLAADIFGMVRYKYRDERMSAIIQEARMDLAMQQPRPVPPGAIVQDYAISNAVALEEIRSFQKRHALLQEEERSFRLDSAIATIVRELWCLVDQTALTHRHYELYKEMINHADQRDRQQEETDPPPSGGTGSVN